MDILIFLCGVFGRGNYKEWYSFFIITWTYSLFMLGYGLRNFTNNVTINNRVDDFIFKKVDVVRG